MSLEKERALVTEYSVLRWFAGLEEHINQVDPTLLTDPSRIFNADESGFSFDPRHRKVTKVVQSCIISVPFFFNSYVLCYFISFCLSIYNFLF